MESVSIVMNSESLALETPSSLEPHRRGMLRVGQLRGERSGTPYIRRNALNGYSPWRSAEVRASSFDCPPGTWTYHPKPPHGSLCYVVLPRAQTESLSTTEKDDETEAQGSQGTYPKSHRKQVIQYYTASKWKGLGLSCDSLAPGSCYNLRHDTLPSS